MQLRVRAHLKIKMAVLDLRTDVEEVPQFQMSSHVKCIFAQGRDHVWIKYKLNRIDLTGDNCERQSFSCPVYDSHMHLTTKTLLFAVNL